MAAPLDAAPHLFDDPPTLPGWNWMALWVDNGPLFGLYRGASQDSRHFLEDNLGGRALKAYPRWHHDSPVSAQSNVGKTGQDIAGHTQG